MQLKWKLRQNDTLNNFFTYFILRGWRDISSKMSSPAEELPSFDVYWVLVAFWLRALQRRYGEPVPGAVL